MADLKTNLLGFVMNSPVIGASGTSADGSLTPMTASRTALKSCPLFEEKAPGTFSHTINLGFSPLVLHLISFTIRIAS